MKTMDSERSAKQRVEKRKRYSKWINRSVGFGVGSFLIATAVWIVVEESAVLFVGLGLYWLGCLGMAIGYRSSPVSVRDELEQLIEQEASQTTLTFLTAVTIIGFPAEVVLNTTGIYTAPPTVRGAIWGYLVLILVYITTHWATQRQYT